MILRVDLKDTWVNSVHFFSKKIYRYYVFVLTIADCWFKLQRYNIPVIVLGQFSCSHFHPPRPHTWIKYLQYCSNVSWQSRLETRSSKFLRIENRVSSFKFRVLIFEDREPSFEFWDTRRIFWGSRTEISRKRFISRKQNNSDDQTKTINARLYSHKPTVECMQIFFHFVHFLPDTSRLLIYTVADDSKLQLA